MAFTPSAIGGGIDAATGMIKTASDPNASLKDLVGSAEDVYSAVTALFADGNEDDWRVRLSLPDNVRAFQESLILEPLRAAGGMIFPYTPRIGFGNTAKYTPIDVTHTNYTFQAYINSQPKAITIEAPMNVETQDEARYWIAAKFYFEAITKMFTGNDIHAGNPPPIVLFSGYGKHMFNKVPVVITSFGTSLESDCDYIKVGISGSLMNDIIGIAGGVESAFGSLSPAVGKIAETVSEIASVAGDFGLDIKTSGDLSYVPTKSTFSISLQPVYSRASVLRFSNDIFVKGGYATQIGYL